MKNRKLNDREVRWCLLDAFHHSIRESLEGLGVNTLRMTGYDRDSDRVHFINEGRKCTLYGVKWSNDDDLNAGVLTMLLKAKNNGIEDIWEVRVNLDTLRTNTMERIAYEVYDFCRGEDWEDWEIYRKELVANWLDSYQI